MFSKQGILDVETQTTTTQQTIKAQITLVYSDSCLDKNHCELKKLQKQPNSNVYVRTIKIKKHPRKYHQPIPNRQ